MLLSLVYRMFIVSMNDYSHEDIELGRRGSAQCQSHLSDAPPSPGGVSDSFGSPNANTATEADGPYMRTNSGRRVDRRLWVFVMAALFTTVVLVFSMAMICWRYDVQVWLPVMTFAVGVWTGQLPTGGSTKSRKNRQAPQTSVLGWRPPAS